MYCPGKSKETTPTTTIVLRWRAWHGRRHRLWKDPSLIKQGTNRPHKWVAMGKAKGRKLIRLCYVHERERDGIDFRPTFPNEPKIKTKENCSWELEFALGTFCACYVFYLYGLLKPPKGSSGVTNFRNKCIYRNGAWVAALHIFLLLFLSQISHLSVFSSLRTFSSAFRLAF